MSWRPNSFDIGIQHNASHWREVIMSATVSQITGVSVVWLFFFSCKKIKAPRHWQFWGETTTDRWIPPQRTINAENVFIWWRHHVDKKAFSNVVVTNRLLQNVQGLPNTTQFSILKRPYLCYVLFTLMTFVWEAALWWSMSFLFARISFWTNLHLT